MFIEKVIIKNFKSYKDETVFDGLSPGLNLLVGDNGHGKTNCLTAIMFALVGHGFVKPLDRRTRLCLLYDSDKSGSVELVFGFKDGHPGFRRRKVLSIKRVLSLKNDEFFINGKKVVNKSFNMMFEYAGFSPIGCRHMYVEQGMVASMALASNAEFLQLLLNATDYRSKEYDEGFEDISTEFEERMKSITSLCSKWERTAVDQKVHNLVEKKRALENLLHRRHHQEATKEQTELETDKNTLEVELEKLKLEFREAWRKERRASRLLQECQMSFQATDEEFNTVCEDFKSLRSAQMVLNSVVRDLTKRMPLRRDSKEEAERQLRSVNDVIKQTRDELAEVNSSFERIQGEENEVKLNLYVVTQKIKQLHVKKERLGRFTSKDERDQEIKTELESLKAEMIAQLNNNGECKEYLRKYSEELESLTAKSEGLMDKLRVAVDLESGKQLLEIRTKVDQQECKSRFCRRMLDKIDRRLLSLKEELNSVNTEFSKVIGENILEGEESVNEVLDLWRSRGDQMANLAATSYHGMVIDSFHCEWQYYVPVWVSAGKRLIHHIVDSSEVADAIMAEVERQNLPGVIKFLYLDRLRSEDQTLPAPEVEDVIPLMGKLEYEPRYEEALKEVFGKTLICTSFKVSTKLVGELGFNCVTMEGEKLSTKGFLTTMNFASCWPTILDIHDSRRSLRQEIGSAQEERKRVLELRTLENEVLLNLIDEMDTLEGKFLKAQIKYDQIKKEFTSDSQSLRQEISRRELHKAEKSHRLACCDMTIAGLWTVIEVLEAELLEDLFVDLPVANQEELEFLSTEMFRLNQTLELTSQKRIKYERQKDILVEQLECALRIRDELNLCVFRNSVEYKEELLRQKSHELALVSRKAQETEGVLEKLRRELGTRHEEFQMKQKVLEECKADAKYAQERLIEVTTEFRNLADRFFSQRCHAQNLAEEHFELQRPPPDNLEECLGWKSAKLVEELKKVESKRKTQLNENAGALPQHLHAQQKTLKKKRKDLENSRSLERVFDVTEESAWSLFNTDFRKIRTHFIQKFRTLIPGGTADLTLQTTDGEERTSTAGLHIDDVVGLGVHVSFDRNGRIREMRELSTGQKNIVTLAFVFALLECFPVPLMLLDEVVECVEIGPYTDAIYDLMRTVSKKTQLIATTFGLRMLSRADRIYGVGKQDMVSYADLVDENTARTYLRGGADVNLQ